MSYFQQSILNKHIALQNQTELAEKWAQFQAGFGNPDKQANIRSSKEEQYQEGFLNDLFVKIFGYTLNPEPNFNLVTEQKNQTDSKKADGAIIHNHQVIAVIELKGTDTRDLNKIVEQAFGYKNNNAHCRYVIVSNFQKIRFYIQNATEYLEFDLFALNEAQFQTMYLIFKKENLCSGLPEQIKAQSLSAEETITKQLYADYSAFKRDLFADLIQHNPQHNKLALFQKSQKLLDRFLFIFFAEDCKLLPPNAVLNIIGDWEKLAALDVEIPLYERIKQYFGWLDSGNEAKQIFAYNGGLFKPDAELDALVISDSVLEQHCRKIAQYDFSSQIDVNILGHIFEHSLNEIDEIHAELNGEKIDKKQSKRKKDGVFYTPKYITQYIIQNTVGKLCADKKAELGLSEDYLNSFKLPEKGMRKETAAKLIAAAQEPLQKIEAYRQWLLNITICDPACGSGAFLNEALNFLIAEHTQIDEMQSRLAGSTIVFHDIEHAILERNLYGVDINEESVEIAKLSLWLRTAQRHRKLNNLNNNIMCGNSLIEDTAVAGDKAFSFQTAFPQVFEQGGFDVVIGNPPYVKLEQIKETSKQLESVGFETFEKRGDLYVLFVEKGFNILKENGNIAYIMPNKWLQAGYGKPLRRFFLRQNLQQLIDFGDVQIFEGATTYPCIFVAEKAAPQETVQAALLQAAMKNDFPRNVADNMQHFQTASFDENTWVISSGSGQDLLGRLKNQFASLDEFVGNDIYRGVLTGLNEAFFVEKNKLAKSDKLKPFVQGRNIARYVTPEAENDLLVFEKGFTKHRGINDEAGGEFYLAQHYPEIYQHLLPFKEKAKARGDKGDFWWELRACDYYDAFEQPKIMFQEMQVKPCFVYDESGLYCNNKVYIIPSNNKGLLAILNSKLGWWLLTQFCTRIRGGYQVSWQYLKQIPIAKPTSELSELAETMLQLNRDFQTASGKFERLLCRRFNIEKPSKALQQWFELDFKAFAAALKKHKVSLSLKDEMEWEELFTESQADIRALQAKMAATDQTIDEKVFALYGLNDEEIALVCA